MGWDEVEPLLRERAYRTADPLSGDCGPVHLDADLIFARLFGFDGQVDRDGLQLPVLLPDLHLPIPHIETFTGETLTAAARYVLQSGAITATVPAVDAPEGMRLRADFTFKVAYVRYRRRPAKAVREYMA